MNPSDLSKLRNGDYFSREDPQKAQRALQARLEKIKPRVTAAAAMETGAAGEMTMEGTVANAEENPDVEMRDDGHLADKENIAMDLNVNTQELMSLLECKGIQVLDKENDE